MQRQISYTNDPTDPKSQINVLEWVPASRSAVSWTMLRAVEWRDYRVVSAASMADGFASVIVVVTPAAIELAPETFTRLRGLGLRARRRADAGEVIRVLAIVRLLVMVAGFVVVVVFTRRRAKQRLDSIATLDRPPFAEPTASDVRGALAEMMGISAASAADSKWTITSAEEGSRGPEVAEAVWSRIPRVSSAVWVAAELPRSVVLPITFAPWKPSALASFERGRRSRYGIDEGVFVRDDRLGRNWLAWVGRESDAARALDADPAVWAVVQRITPALVTATAAAAPDSSEPAVPAPSGFRLGSGTRISFRGRFVLVGPGFRTESGPQLEPRRSTASRPIPRQHVRQHRRVLTQPGFLSEGAKQD